MKVFLMRAGHGGGLVRGHSGSLTLPVVLKNTKPLSSTIWKTNQLYAASYIIPSTQHSLISDPGRQLIFGQMVLGVSLIREYITLNKN